MPNLSPLQSEPQPVLTIGYGGARPLAEFFALLAHAGIKYLLDVRSKPYSKYRPEFSREALEGSAREQGFVYVYMGDSLGGLPSDTTCYTEGKVDYSKVREREWFKHGLERVESGWRQGYRLALMCAELEPERCHRSKLIGEALTKAGVSVAHIDENGAVVSQDEVLRRLTGGQAQLFDLGLTSRKRYVSPAESGDETS